MVCTGEPVPFRRALSLTLDLPRARPGAGVLPCRVLCALDPGHLATGSVLITTAPLDQGKVDCPQFAAECELLLRISELRKLVVYSEKQG